jgi:hypothetical protein
MNLTSKLIYLQPQQGDNYRNKMFFLKLYVVTTAYAYNFVWQFCLLDCNFVHTHCARLYIGYSSKTEQMDSKLSDLNVPYC